MHAIVGMMAIQMDKITHSIMIEMKNVKIRAISIMKHSYRVASQ